MIGGPVSSPDLSIGDVASLTGVGESTLRMWETRYSFPTPRRLPSGHRRYTERDLARIRSVLQAREEGLPLSIAIGRAQRLEAEPRPSVYAALRQRFPHLHPRLLPKPVLLWISHGIEDECCARAPRPRLLACFQQERFYRQAQARWRELARSAECAVVLADFPALAEPERGPIEVPIHRRDPLMREWVLACDAPELAACLVAWERPRGRGQARMFETIWTVEPDVVREAARLCCDLAARQAAGAVEGLRRALAEAPAPAPSPAEQVRAAVELTTRIMLYAAGDPVAARPG